MTTPSESNTSSSSNAAYQTLFQTSERTGVVTLSASNPASEVKDRTTQGAYFYVLTPPNCTNNNVAGYIQLSFSPQTGQNLTYNNLSFTTEAQVANNPIRLLVKSSADQYGATLATIATGSRITTTV